MSSLPIESQFKSYIQHISQYNKKKVILQAMTNAKLHGATKRKRKKKSFRKLPAQTHGGTTRNDFYCLLGTPTRGTLTESLLHDFRA